MSQTTIIAASAAEADDGRCKAMPPARRTQAKAEHRGSSVDGDGWQESHKQPLEERLVPISEPSAQPYRPQPRNAIKSIAPAIAGHPSLCKHGAAGAPYMARKPL